MGLIKTAAEILGGAPRPVDLDYRSSRKGVGGRPPLHRQCTLPDCTRKHHGNGYCRPHNLAWLKYGDPYGTYKRPKRCTCATCPVHTPDLEEEL